MTKHFYVCKNGTPRQSLLVPFSTHCLIVFFNFQVPPTSLEDLEEYSHCWIIYVFNLNIDLEKILTIDFAVEVTISIFRMICLEECLIGSMECQYIILLLDEF